MDSFEFNKLVGWVLVAGIAAWTLGELSHIFLEKEHGEPKRGYQIEVAEVAEGGEAAAEVDFMTLLATADIAAGEKVYKKCVSCHTIEEGGVNKVGPNLYGIVGANHAHISGFAYSGAMLETKDKIWDFESLSGFLEAPAKYLPGTKMSFAGLRNAQERANVIAYLNSNSKSPLPLPVAPAAPTEAPAAEGESAPATEEAPNEEAKPNAE